MEKFLSKRIVLVTGKGGVGRSTVTAALAVASARRGNRVLVSEIEEPCGGFSPLARLFGREHLPVKPIQLAPGIEGGQLTAAKGQEAFLTGVLKVRTMARLAMRTKPLLAFLRFAPSFHEMGIFYHLLSHIKSQTKDKRNRYDQILIDMPATGHTLALTALPEQLLSLIRSGPIATGMREGQKWLNDPATGAAYVVTIPETLPVTECMELIDGLQQTNMPVGGVILNMVPENPFSSDERQALKGLLDGRPFFGQRYLDRIATTDRAAEKLKSELHVGLLSIPYCKASGTELPQVMASRLLGESPGES